MHLKVLNLERHVSEWENCTKCTFGSFAHKHVFTRGDIPCQVLFIGEAPGKTEDVTGVPFVGRAGKLLETWISESHTFAFAAVPGYTHYSHAITNLLVCRPADRPGGPNRPPTFQEISNCNPRLVDFVVRLAKPVMVVTLGRFAGVATPEWAGLPKVELQHPAYVLRQGGAGSTADKQNKAKLNEAIAKEFSNVRLNTFR